jgi:hypothetical protein
MDGKQLDTIARALFSASNRRRTLSSLLGAALAAGGVLAFPLGGRHRGQLRGAHAPTVPLNPTFRIACKRGALMPG